ncbi:MAG: hypothetical protein RLZZ156_494 [Deinococcota bacterium]|jgi:hypothetical protein
MKTKSLFALAVAGVVSLLPVLAQTSGTTGNNIAQVFQLTEVTNKRGKIILGTDVASTLEFDSEVVEWAIGRDDLLLEPKKSAGNTGLIYLRGKAQSGSSSLDVMLVGGEMARFTFTINPKLTEGQRYIVKSTAKPAASDTQTQAQAPSDPITNRPDLPVWLRLEWRANVTASKDVFLSYNLSNQGAGQVITDAAKLGVYATRDGKTVKIPYTLARSSSTGNTFMMAAESNQTGTLTLKATDVSAVKDLLVQWTLQDNATKISYLIEKRLSLEASDQTFLRIPVRIPQTAAMLTVKPEAKKNAKPEAKQNTKPAKISKVKPVSYRPFTYQRLKAGLNQCRAKTTWSTIIYGSHLKTLSTAMQKCVAAFM